MNSPQNPTTQKKKMVSYIVFNWTFTGAPGGDNLSLDFPCISMVHWSNQVKNRNKHWGIWFYYLLIYLFTWAGKSKIGLSMSHVLAPAPVSAWFLKRLTLLSTLEKKILLRTHPLPTEAYPMGIEGLNGKLLLLIGWESVVYAYIHHTQ